MQIDVSRRKFKKTILFDSVLLHEAIFKIWASHQLHMVWGQHINWNVKLQRSLKADTTVIYISVNNGGLLIHLAFHLIK